MTEDEVRKRIAEINVWKRGDTRAPHKPLLILMALGAAQRGDSRLLAYDDVDGKLRALLEEFGPPRRSYHPEYPFWRLERDGVWELDGLDSTTVRERGADPSPRELIDRGVRGGFTPKVFGAVHSDPDLLREVAHDILDAHFPESLHEDILAAVGLELARGRYQTERTRRDPDFRDRVLIAYESRCGVCGFTARLHNTLIGLEAAHIMWHQAGGPDVETNGLSLCSLHHKLFDRGAFTLDAGKTIRVSQLVTGGDVAESWLHAFHGSALSGPQSSEYEPAAEFLEWHEREVFRGPARH